MAPALVELLASKCTPAAKLVGLHLAMATSAGEQTTVRPRDVGRALNIPLFEVERAWREIMKLGWISSPRPDVVVMPAESPPRLALSRPEQQRRRAPKTDNTQETAT